MSTDPIGLFEETTRRFNAEDWEGVVDLCDAASLSVFRRNLLAFYAPRHSRQFTAEDYLIHSPDMPREVAEYKVQQEQKADDPLRRVRQDMPRINSLEELHALGTRDLYVAWLRSQSLRGQFEKQVAAGLASKRAAGGALKKLGDYYSFRPIGMVMDGERVAHVLYQGGPAPESWPMVEAELVKAGIPEDERKLKLDLFGHEHPGVLTCRRGPDGEWRLLAEHSPFGMGTGAFAIGEDENDSQDT